MQETIFTKIINGVIPCYKIAENDTFFAFLDINPLSIGHTLVVPKNPVDYFFDMSKGELSDIMIFSKNIAEKLQSVTKCERVGLTMIGFEVPHAHLHLIPMNSMVDMDFSKEKLKLTQEEFVILAEKIRNA
jgi:histidine triad (HIT) family protein